MTVPWVKEKILTSINLFLVILLSSCEPVYPELTLASNALREMIVAS